MMLQILALVLRFTSKIKDRVFSSVPEFTWPEVRDFLYHFVIVAAAVLTCLAVLGVF